MLLLFSVDSVGVFCQKRSREGRWIEERKKSSARIRRIVNRVVVRRCRRRRLRPDSISSVRMCDMGLLRTMTVLRVHPASPPHHAGSSGSWNKRMRHLSSPVLYLTALLA